MRHSLGLGNDWARLEHDAAHTADSRQNVVDVGRLIRESLVPQHPEYDLQNQFVPIGKLLSIFSDQTIERIIRETFKEVQDQVVQLRDEVQRSDQSPGRIMILATLILIDKPEYLSHFIENRLFDTKLPLQHKECKSVFTLWTPSDVDNFCDRQYVVLAPVFDFGSAEVAVRFLSRKTHLPFLEPLEWERRGAHGIISKVKIHPDHQLWGPDWLPEHQKSCLAVKKFTSENSDSFEKERQALLRFTKPRKGHGHLIKLLYSYQFRGEYFMIFPWAQSNLAELWERSQCNAASGQDCFWIIQQCWGIADGLRKVHRHDSWPPDMKMKKTDNRGRHGDIKPENILHFPNGNLGRGRLVVADFTLMRFHSERSLNRTQADQIGFSRTYRPPEVEFGKGVGVSQKYDVWTLGCVYLEFVTWYLLGYNATRGEYFQGHNGQEFESFSTVRSSDDERQGSYASDKFFNGTNGRRPRVKDSVTRWIKMLYCNENCSGAMHEFLNLIENHMLLPFPDDRCSMEIVAKRLAEILRECDRDDYCCLGRPNSVMGYERFPPFFTSKSMQYNQISEFPRFTDDPLDNDQNSDLHAIVGLMAHALPATVSLQNQTHSPLSKIGSTLAGDDSVAVTSRHVLHMDNFERSQFLAPNHASSQTTLMGQSSISNQEENVEAKSDPTKDHHFHSRHLYPGVVPVSNLPPQETTQATSVERERISRLRASYIVERVQRWMNKLRRMVR